MAEQTEKAKVQGVKYIGHKEAVQVPTDGPTYKFPRGTAVMVPATIAGGLLKQGEKFQVASQEEIDKTQKAKEAASKPKTKPASGTATAVPGGK